MDFAEGLREDRMTAWESALQAADCIRSLQATGVWQALSIDVRRTICKAHATLEALTTAMVDQEVV